MDCALSCDNYENCCENYYFFLLLRCKVKSNEKRYNPTNLSGTVRVALPSRYKKKTCHVVLSAPDQFANNQYFHVKLYIVLRLHSISLQNLD